VRVSHRTVQDGIYTFTGISVSFTAVHNEIEKSKDKMDKRNRPGKRGQNGKSKSADCFEVTYARLCIRTVYQIRERMRGSGSSVNSTVKGQLENWIVQSYPGLPWDLVPLRRFTPHCRIYPAPTCKILTYVQSCVTPTSSSKCKSMLAPKG
jgi:hypothetical protein